MEIAEMIKKYGITIVVKSGQKMLHSWETVAIKRDGMMDELKARKEEIIAHIEAEEAEKKSAFEARQAKINAIPGLKEIIRAQKELAEYREAFNEAMERGDGFLPAKPEIDIDALISDYPWAAAYLKAEKEANKSNYEISAIGRKALEAVIEGDWQRAMEEMGKELDEFAKRHIWD